MRTRSGWFAVVPAVLATALYAAADREIYRSTDVVQETQMVDCLGTIDLTLTLRIHVLEGLDANGGYHLVFHGNISRFSAVDSEGNRYSGSETYQDTIHVAPGGFPYTETFVYGLRGESHGSAPNILVKTRFKLTINAPGRVTVSRSLDTVECIPD